MATSALVGHMAFAEPIKPLADELLEQHPRIKAAESSLNSAQAAIQEATSGYLPKLDFSTGAGFENDDRSDLNPPGDDTNLNPRNASVTATQNLFEGFRTKAATRTATANVNVAEATLDLTRQQVLFEAVTAYMDVLRHQQLTKLSEQNQDTLKKQLNLEDERVQRGSGIAVDVLQAKSRLQISMERYSAFSGALKDAVSRYTQVFGKPPGLDSMTLLRISGEAIPPNLEQAIDKAKSLNPNLVASQKNIDIADAAREGAKAGYFPSVDVVARSTYDEDVEGISGEETTNSLMLRANWNAFNGFADKSRIEQAAHNHASAMESAQYTERKVVEEVKLAWQSVQTSRERAELLDNAVNIAGEVLDARIKLRDVGKDTALNVLDAENELFRAKIDAVAARYDYYVNVYRLFLAMGVLTPDKI